MKNNDLSFRAFCQGIGGRVLKRGLPMIPIDTITTWASFHDAVQAAIEKTEGWDWQNAVVARGAAMSSTERVVLAAALAAARDAPSADEIGSQGVWQAIGWSMAPDTKLAVVAAILQID